MAAICPRWGCLKKARWMKMGGVPKKARCNQKSQEQEEKKIGSPSAVGVFETPHRQVQGTLERNFLEGYEGCDAACDRAWSSRSKEFPGSCLMLLNVIQSMGCSRELTERNWKSNRRSCIVNTYTCIHTCKVNQHALPGSIIPRNMLPMLSLRIDPIWFAIDLEDDSSSAYSYPVMTSVFEVGGMRVEVLQFI